MFLGIFMNIILLEGIFTAEHNKLTIYFLESRKRDYASDDSLVSASKGEARESHGAFMTDTSQLS